MLCLNILALRAIHSESARNKGEILPNFYLEITQYDFIKRGGEDEAWTKSLS